MDIHTKHGKVAYEITYIGKFKIMAVMIYLELSLNENSDANENKGRVRAMKYRSFGRTGWQISSVSFGAWAIGGSWGATDDEISIAALDRAIDLGVNFIDTADVYGDGRSERIIGTLLRRRSERIYVATKIGRRLEPHVAEGYSKANLTAFVERSLVNLGVDALDLAQLHCPPTKVFHTPEVFAVLDDLVQDGKIRHYGVSVETVDEALTAITYPNVQSVQIIFNIFRQKPAEAFFAAARAKQVGILARVPLASGLLTGKFRADSIFAEDDHRNFNRFGESFDRGETFSGVDYAVGLQAAEVLRQYIPAGVSLAQFALRWILMFPEVTAAIPGAKTAVQEEENSAAADLPPLSAEAMAGIQSLYNERIKPHVHQYW